MKDWDAERTATITIAGHSINVNETNNTHTIRLNDYVGHGHDISQIWLIGCGGGRSYVSRVEIRVGSAVIPMILNADGTLVLPDGGIQMSRIWVQYTYLILHICPKYIRDNCVYGEVDEYETIMSVSDELDEFIDEETGDIRTGYLRRSERVPTGRTSRIVVRDADVLIPDVEVVMCSGVEAHAPAQAPAYFWDEFVIDPRRNTDEDIKRMVTIHSLIAVDGGDVYSRTSPFRARAKNILRYKDGFAAPLYTF